MNLDLSRHWMAMTLATLTVVTSFTVNALIKGSPFANVTMVDLQDYGGTTFEDLGNFELWRIPVSQLIHANPLHTFYNALIIVFLGAALEDRIGSWRLLAIWLIAGGIGTVISPILSEAPWNVGTGASQATFAFAGCASLFALLSPINRIKLIVPVAITIAPGLALDFILAGYPKPGHVTGFVIGAAFGWLYREIWSRGAINEGHPAL